MRVGPPGGLETVKVPSMDLIRASSPATPPPGSMRALSSSTATRRLRSPAWTVIVAVLALACLVMLVMASAAT